jgi:hypothetical protein
LKSNADQFGCVENKTLILLIYGDSTALRTAHFEIGPWCHRDGRRVIAVAARHSEAADILEIAQRRGLLADLLKEAAERRPKPQEGPPCAGPSTIEGRQGCVHRRTPSTGLARRSPRRGVTIKLAEDRRGRCEVGHIAATIRSRFLRPDEESIRPQRSRKREGSGAGRCRARG